MSKINVEVELFRADYCGYCKRMMPEWEKFKKMDKDDKYNIIINDYEASKQSAEIAKITKQKQYLIDGYPTIMITVGNDEPHKYGGERTAEKIMEHIKTQKGGKRKNKKNKKMDMEDIDDAQFELLYYKYKSKYLKSKQ